MHESSPNWHNPLLLAGKRLFDLCVSGPLLVVLSPLFLILALAVKLTSRGPVFYRWQVVGKGGRPFTGYKFRSMCLNADLLKPQLEPLNEMRGPVFKLTKECAVKGAGLQRVQLPPGNWFAPPGSNRNGGGGNKAVGAFDVEGR